MRLLFTIPHYYRCEERGRHSSTRSHSRERVRALAATLTALHQLFGKRQSVLNHEQRVLVPANEPQAHDIDIVVCTIGDNHVLEHLPFPRGFFEHQACTAEPLFLGFECQAVLRDRLGAYDYFCYLEDDVIVRDAWLFPKLAWFNRQFGDKKLLQPNRFEIGPHRPLEKVYVDGDLRRRVTTGFQNVDEESLLTACHLGVPIQFHRPLNPHSGCYFLNTAQMHEWAQRPYFLDRDTRFIGPLESAATLGIMRTLQVYKPAPANANFLEVRHFTSDYIRRFGNQSPSS